VLFLLLICADPSVEVSEEQADVAPWLEEMERRGVRLHGNRLDPVSEAKSVKVRGAARLVTDGPFAETKEQIGGFDVIDCSSLDEAIEIASKHPVATFGTIEVRPFYSEV
jgi:hypothetical protein